ncbi:hypothetical protein SDC9_110489 [bioreactor metagenome]|uniref:Uncharacterized protein n=1 Tax=bioreactor metagenome TaxID=1076179 RepID=A0A645BEX7_9ZZZZ
MNSKGSVTPAKIDAVAAAIATTLALFLSLAARYIPTNAPTIPNTFIGVAPCPNHTLVICEILSVKSGFPKAAVVIAFVPT